MSNEESSPSQATRFNLDPATVPLIAGFSGGVVSTLLLLPLEIVKLRLQVSESDGTSTTKPIRRWRSFRILGGIVKYEGIRGLYQGWVPAVLGSAISWGGYFYFYEGLKRKLIEYKLSKQQQQQQQQSLQFVTKDGASVAIPSSTKMSLTSLDNFILACTSGAIMVALTNPIWLLKTRLMLQMRRASEQHDIKPYANMVDAFRTIVREEGALALYKGSGPALLLTSHGGVQFVVYEYLRKQFHFRRLNRDEGKNLTLWHRLELSAGYLTIGAVAKLAATTTTYPLQLIKSRMQQREQSIELMDDGQVRAVKREYTGMLQTARRIYTREGVSGFFKGCIPNAIRVAPGAAVTFVVYEEVTDLLTSIELDQQG